jgi:protease-4
MASPSAADDTARTDEYSPSEPRSTGETATPEDAAEPPASARFGNGWQSAAPLVLLGLAVGVLIWVVVPIGPGSGTVAVIPVEGGINGNAATDYGLAVDRALEDPSVDAIVLRVNSPGGSATASESMHLETLRAAEEVPVVASVDSMAASGGYYAAVGSDHIVAKPSSLLGSVGVAFTPPEQSQPTDDVVVTGPNKLGGASERGWYYKTETLQAAFLSAVTRHRGDDLTVSSETLSTGKLFTGIEAVEAGVADEVGGTRTAVQQAAARAGLSDYDVRVVRPSTSVRFITRSNYLASDAPNKTMASPTYFLGPPESRFPNHLMVPQDILGTAIARESGPSADGRPTVGTVNATNESGVSDD